MLCTRLQKLVYENTIAELLTVTTYTQTHTHTYHKCTHFEENEIPLWMRAGTIAYIRDDMQHDYSNSQTRPHILYQSKKPKVCTSDAKFQS